MVDRFCVVFGLNASPFLLNATLRHHISKLMAVDPEFVKKLIDSFYVDDFVGGGASLSEVVNFYSKTVNRMADGGFKFRKWLTNDPSVREKIKKDLIDEVKLDPVSAENVTYAKSSLGLKMGSNGQKVLGLSWDFEQDTITLELTAIAKRAEDLPATKRNTLRLLAGIFDPLGMIGPITITANNARLMLALASFDKL